MLIQEASHPRDRSPPDEVLETLRAFLWLQYTPPSRICESNTYYGDVLWKYSSLWSDYFMVNMILLSFLFFKHGWHGLIIQRQDRSLWVLRQYNRLVFTRQVNILIARRSSLDTISWNGLYPSREAAEENNSRRWKSAGFSLRKLEVNGVVPVSPPGSHSSRVELKPRLAARDVVLNESRFCLLKPALWEFEGPSFSIYRIECLGIWLA